MADAPLPALQIQYDNERPVDLLDLTGSLSALGERYQEFAAERGAGEGARLYVREMRVGSIIAELQPLLEQMSFVLEHRETIAAFTANLNDLFRFFLALPPRPWDSDVSRRDAEQVQKILEPTAKDGGAQLFLNINGDHAAPVININAERAGAIQSGARRFLDAVPLPANEFFEGEVLYLKQVKDDPQAKTGDRGVIDAISTRPVKILFMSEEAKQAILKGPDNPFRLAFLVDGQVKTVEGKPALYKIYAVRDAFERP